ncbi:MAG: PAS domain-containing sensor histidine kinase [Candidatus Bathyarchaeota archaeon]|nr:PAS domain-containing sensor histidine kinase [Candidatus Bathyarchaeota archaeon]
MFTPTGLDAHAFLDAANVLVQSVDKDGKFVFVNKEWKQVLGYTDAEISSLSIEKIIRKDHLEFCLNVFRKVTDGACVRDCETVFVAKDGREINVSGNACANFKDGEFVSTVAFFVDVTARKKSEQRLKESTRRIELMNEKLRVVGELSRHDVRNKLSGITNIAYLLKKKHADLPDVVAGIQIIEQAICDSVDIFDFAKTYEQLGVEKLTYIDVETKIKDAQRLFSVSIPTIISDCRGLRLLGDSFLMQLFYNLVDNTRKYGEKATTIRVTYKVNQGNLELIYEDNGVGVPIENKVHIFQKGFSTGGSTGFGLFLISKMIDVYGWKIQETGLPNQGAKFVITIPKKDEQGRFNYLLCEDKNALNPKAC